MKQRMKKEKQIFNGGTTHQSRGRRFITGRMTAGRGLTSPEEEEDDSDVAEEKLGLRLSGGKIAEAIFLLFSGCAEKALSF